MPRFIQHVRYAVPRPAPGPHSNYISRIPLCFRVWLNHLLKMALGVVAHVETITYRWPAANCFSTFSLLVNDCHHALLSCVNLELSEPALNRDHQYPGRVILIARTIEEAYGNSCSSPHVDCDYAILHCAENAIHLGRDEEVTVVDPILQGPAGGPVKKIHRAAHRRVNEATSPLQPWLFNLESLVVLLACLFLGIKAKPGLHLGFI